MNKLTHVCRICLAGGDILQLHSIENTPLQDTFEILSNTHLIRQDLPKSVCYICHSQLKKCQQFMRFVQESEAILEFILLRNTTADLLAKKVGSRSLLKLQRIAPVLLSVPDVNLPAPEIKTEVVEAEDREKETELSQKETEETVDKDIESIEEQVTIKDNVNLIDEKPSVKRVEIMEIIEDTINNERDATDEDKEELMAKERIVMLKEEVVPEKEQEAKANEIKVIKKEEVLIKQELIVMGNALEEEPVAVMEDEAEDAPIPEFCNPETATTKVGLVNVSSRTLLNELQKVLQRNSGLLPEIKEMEVDSIDTPPPVLKYNCMICERGFPTEAKRDLHMLVHKEDTPYGCLHCRRAFAKQAHLDSHMRVHMSEKECKICEITFPPRAGAGASPASALAAHMRTTHMSERHLCCKKCKKRYRTIGALVAHHKTHKTSA